MRQNVLLIASDFAPSSGQTARFPTKLAKYLTRLGFEVTVLTGECEGGKDPVLRADLPECGRVLRTSVHAKWSLFARLLRRPIGTQKMRGITHVPVAKDEMRPNESHGRFSNFVRGAFLSRRVKKQEQSFYRAALAYVQHSGLDLSHFDVMISTYAPMSAHMVALALKAKCPTLKWISDFREALPKSAPRSLCRFYNKWKKRVLAHSDVVTASGVPLMKELCGKRANARGTVIPNGFDAQDLLRIPFAEEAERRPFTVVIKSPFDLRRTDVGVLFSAVEDLMKSGRVRRDQIVFEYYGSRRTAAYLNSLIEQMDMPPYFYDCGSVRKMELLSAQRRAQLLVLPAWDWRAERGEVPVGLYEALALQKPVLVLLFGDVAGGEFSRIMRSLRIGYCFEEEVGRDSYEGMKKYIAECLTYWRTRSRDLYEPDEKRYRSLDFEVLARQWAEIIND